MNKRAVAELLFVNPSANISVSSYHIIIIRLSITLAYNTCTKAEAFDTSNYVINVYSSSFASVTSFFSHSWNRNLSLAITKTQSVRVLLQ